MGLREKMNENPRLTSGVMIAVIVIALFLIYWFQIRRPAPLPPNAAPDTPGAVRPSGRPGTGDQTPTDGQPTDQNPGGDAGATDPNAAQPTQ